MSLSDEQRKLLEEWREDANILLYANFAQAEACRRRSSILGALSAALSAIVGTAVFASIGKDSSMYAQVIVGLTLHTFLNFGDLASRHHKAGSGYAAIRKNIEELLAIPPPDQEELRGALVNIRDMWTSLREESVPMSSRTLRKAAKK